MYLAVALPDILTLFRNHLLRERKDTLEPFDILLWFKADGADYGFRLTDFYDLLIRCVAIKLVILLLHPDQQVNIIRWLSLVGHGQYFSWVFSKSRVAEAELVLFGFHQTIEDVILLTLDIISHGPHNNFGVDLSLWVVLLKEVVGGSLKVFL